MADKMYNDFQDAYEHETIKELRKRQELEDTMKTYYSILIVVMILALLVGGFIAYQLVQILSLLK